MLKLSRGEDASSALAKERFFNFYFLIFNSKRVNSQPPDGGDFREIRREYCGDLRIIESGVADWTSKSVASRVILGVFMR